MASGKDRPERGRSHEGKEL